MSNPAPPLTNESKSSRVPQVVIATTAMLSFISFWRAAAIVLNDLASSAYYAGGIAERAIGPSAPWFILAVMLFAYAVCQMYVESCSMFVRGGVYRVVKEAMGGTLAKFSVSALMFDYILTGPISGVSAGLYLTGFLNEVLHYARINVVLPANTTAAVFAVCVTLYFWWQNIKGIGESSEKASRIMQFTTVMVVLMIGWCGYTLWVKGGHLPPWPRPANLHFSVEAQGWLLHSQLAQVIGLVGIMVAFGHSVLAMSGEETLAQVNREIEHPKLKNLQRAGLVIFVYSLVFTSFVSFLAVMIIPDNVRPNFFANLIGGLAMNVAARVERVHEGRIAREMREQPQLDLRVVRSDQRPPGPRDEPSPNVAPELPAKIEQVLYCELSPRQAALYRDVQEQSERALLDLEASGASENSLRLATLTQLLRLRQVCCDPRLLPGQAEAAA